MKITHIKVHVVNVPERHWWWSDDEYGQPGHQKEEHAIAEVFTDEGLTGLTQVERFIPMDTIEPLIRQWLGLDILKVNLINHRPPLQAPLEQAVLDLRGQALGVPMWQLLGGKLRDWVPITQCTGYKTPQHTAEDAQWGWEKGFRTYKMKCITSEVTPEDRIRYITDRVEAIHRVVPEMAVRPDIRWRLEEASPPRQRPRLRHCRGAGKPGLPAAVCPGRSPGYGRHVADGCLRARRGDGSARGRLYGQPHPPLRHGGSDGLGRRSHQ